MSAAVPLLLALALKVTLLLALAAVVERMALRRASAAARHLLWSTALGAALLLPVLSVALPGWRVALPTPAREAAAPSVPVVAPVADAMRPTAARTVEATPSAAPAPAVVAPRADSPRADSPRVPWTTGLLALYGAGALALLARLAAEQHAVRRLARRAHAVDDGEWRALLRSAAAALGLRRPVALVRADGAAMPLTWGVRRPTVLVPAASDAWPAERRRAVLLHELAHVARHDCLTQSLAALACALYWPHPAVWLAAARLRAERELACDDRALRAGVRGHEYAAHLLAIARGHAGRASPSALALTMAAPSQLEARLRAAIDPRRVRTAPGLRARALGAGSAAALLLPLASVRAGIAAPAASTPRAVVRAAAPAVAVAQPAPAGGRWSMRPATAREAGDSGPALHVMLNTRGLNTFVVPRARLDGLAAGQEASSEGARFRLRQDAGTLAFDGGFRDGRGEGAFTFARDPAFGDTLAALGMARPTAAQQFSLAIHGVPLALLDELRAQGMARPSTDDFVRAGLTSVDVRWLREMRAVGYRLASLPDAVALSNQGVDAGYVRALAAEGYRDLPAGELRRLRVQGIDAAWARQANARAGRRLGVAELVALRVRGVTASAPVPVPAPAPPAAPSAAPSVAPAAEAPRGDTPTTGRWVVHGVRDGLLDLELFWDDGTNWRRWIPASALGASGGGLRIAGDAGTFALDGATPGVAGSGAMRFEPTRAFAATLRTLGVTGADSVGDHQLKNLAWGGMSAADVRDLQALGYGPLALGDVVELAIFQVTPAYARAVRAAGVAGAESVRGIVDLRHGGVPAEYAAELASVGYRGLTVDQLRALRGAGVTGEYVRALRASGAGDLSPEALVERRRGDASARGVLRRY